LKYNYKVVDGVNCSIITLKLEDVFFIKKIKSLIYQELNYLFQPFFFQKNKK